MSKRSELRRKQKEAKKSQKNNTYNKVQIPINVLSGNSDQPGKNFGLGVAEMKIYLDKVEKGVRKEVAVEYQEKLGKAEDLIAVGNILVSIYAIKMSRKGREHTKDLIQRMLDNFGAATAYVEKVGIKEAYKQAHEDFDINIEFDVDEINEVLGV